MHNQKDNLYDSFDRQIWITKGARFNAYRRLKKRNYASIFTIAMLSLYNLCINLWPLKYMPAEMLPFVSPMSMLFSIFVLTLSLLEVGKGYEVKAERLHLNALELNRLYSEWKIAKNDGCKEKMDSAILTYHEVIKSCPENHNPCDEKLFRAEHAHEFNLCFCGVIFNRITYIIQTFWLYIILLFLPLILLLLTFL